MAYRPFALMSAPLLAALAAGCEVSETPHYPGPCSAVREQAWGTGTNTITHTWSYDDEGRMVGVVTHESFWDADTDTVTFTYDGPELVEVHGEPYLPGEGSDVKRFTFGDTVELAMVNSDAIRVEEDASYERSGFTFLGHPVHPVLDAPDALLSSHTVTTNTDTDGGEPEILSDRTVTYTYDGPPRQGRRVRTGSDGSVLTFDYDDQGRLVEYAAITYVYRGDLLTAIGETTYEYDDGGNLVSSNDGTTYSYDCW